MFLLPVFIVMNSHECSLIVIEAPVYNNHVNNPYT